jgi:hypothetical protein
MPTVALLGEYFFLHIPLVNALDFMHSSFLLHLRHIDKVQSGTTFQFHSSISKAKVGESHIISVYNILRAALRIFIVTETAESVQPLDT